jgi:hypothetical protein
MLAQKSAKPATAATVSELRKSEQLGGELGFQATPSFANFQVHRRYRLIAAGWVVVRQNNGWRKSVPIYRRRSVPIVGSEMRS